jgi:hypothetical protein
MIYIGNLGVEPLCGPDSDAIDVHNHIQPTPGLLFLPMALQLRPLLDEIEDPPNPPALVLKYLEDDLLHASNTRRLKRPEAKYSMLPKGCWRGWMFYIAMDLSIQVHLIHN